jgi:hypothetical protein
MNAAMMKRTTNAHSTAVPFAYDLRFPDQSQWSSGSAQDVVIR